MRFIATLLSAAALMTACASTGVVPVDRDTFMISKQSAAGVFGTPGGVQADVYSEANEFCAKTGKKVDTVKIEVLAAVPFVRTGSATLQFRCVA